MLAANVCASDFLHENEHAALYRIHEGPTPEKLEKLREFLKEFGLQLTGGEEPHAKDYAKLLEKVKGRPDMQLLQTVMLRSLQQAVYSPDNVGHFGLAYESYAHFTSPIRRYSDLIVHRALIAGHGWGKDGLSAWDIENLDETAKLISEAERRSMAAERDTTDRYLAAFLADRVGSTFTGRISGVQRFGLFVKLDETGADGLVPIRAVGREFFHFDDASQTLTGADTGMTIGIGQRVTVKLAEAIPVTGGLVLELLEIDGAGLPAGKSRKGGRFNPRKPGAAKAKASKLARKIVRKRRG